jgi:hypothetical protein
MKDNFKYKLILFLIPIFFLGILVECFYRFIPNNYTLKNDYINKNSNNIEVLLFGDSHCFYGLDPTYFHKNTFNISNVSQSIYFDQLILEKYIDKMPNLKQVIFCIEYTNLSQKDNTQDDIWRKYYYNYYMNLDTSILSDFDPKKYSLAFTQSLGMSIDLFIKYYKTNSILDCNPNGWGNNYNKANRIEPSLIAKNRAFNQEDGSLDFKLNSDRISSIISKCNKRNIQVIIVSMPQTKLYVSYLNKTKLNKIFQTCSCFQKNYRDVYYLNLFKDDRFLDDDFYDSDHLNEIGAKKCSQIVNKFIESLN